MSKFKESVEREPTNELVEQEVANGAVAQQPTKDGLPREAFAIMGDSVDPDTWKLPHHTRAIFKALEGRIDAQRTVNWKSMPAAVAAISRGGIQGKRVKARPGEIIMAARHLAGHYQKARKSVPDALAVLI
ncbi:unnamed protein product [marine sediment metagenome]|uniref:Uncharacterized protein n=1 Tax=marine sediment metagenome TaxID=412755 RepID=X1JAB8_9ZZZZ